MKQSIWFLIAITSFSFFAGSCKKQNEFLAAKPDQSLAVPDNLSALMSLVNDDRVFNNTDPGMGVLSSDEFYVTTSSFISAPSIQQNVFVWNPNPYPNQNVGDWTQAYMSVFYANTILTYLSQLKISSSDLATFNQVKGAAYFFRAKTLFELLQIFSLPYDSANSDKLMGLPLKVNADLTIISTRTSQKDCYGQVISDLTNAAAILPVTSQVPTIPNQFAAYGFLSRVYLSMSDYDNALSAANSALAIKNALTDYNTLLAAPSSSALAKNSLYPLVEDGFHSTMNYSSLVGTTKGIVDSNLYRQYDSNDIRKMIFFKVSSGTILYKGSYEFKQSGKYYDGISTDELFLNRAECYARQNNLSASVSDMNTLLQSRYLTGTFSPIGPMSQVDLLNFIIMERRKELFARGLRWVDLRRLNTDPNFATTLTRNVNGSSYSLPPGDLRYALLIPDNEISLSHIPQNAR